MPEGMVPLPNPALKLAEQGSIVLLAMLLFGETRGQDDETKLAVANVVRNRKLAGRYGGDTWEGVILHPRHFSCFNENDINRKKIIKPLEWEKPEVWGACYGIAHNIVDGEVLDNTKRSTHYHDKSLDHRPPFWTKSFTPTVTFGDLRFYRDPLAFKDVPEHDIEAALWGGG